MIRVLVVDDSPFMRRAITRILSSTPDIEVVGAAGSGSEALDMLGVVEPDVMTLDVVMPVEDGVTVLEKVMRTHPVPTLMLSSVTTENAEYTLAALEAGAVDFVTKPTGLTHMNMPRIAEELVSKIRTAAQVDVETLGTARNGVQAQGRPDEQELPGAEPALEHAERVDAEPIEGVIIGCSTGGPAALKRVLQALPSDLAVPVLVVQHMPIGFTAALASRLDTLTRVPVREARDGDIFEGGRVLIAQSGLQVHIARVNGRNTLRLDKDPPDTTHIPSVDVAMRSAAEALGPAAVGVILTGMGTDGAHGLLAMREAGAFTLAEAESSAVVWGMPRVAVEVGAACDVVPLEDVAETVLDRVAAGSATAGPT